MLVISSPSGVRPRVLQIIGLVIVLLLVGGGLVVTGGPATMEALALPSWDRSRHSSTAP